MSIKIGFVMDPLPNINVKKDSSFAMMLAAQKLGWEIHVIYQDDMYTDNATARANSRIVRVMDDRNLVSTSMEQLRFVAGIQGDLPFVDWGSMNNWVYDMGVSYTTSEGTSSRPGIRGDRYDLAAGWYSSTSTKPRG